MPHISFKIKAESISTFGTNGLMSRKYLLFFCTVISSRKLGHYNKKKIR